MANGFLLLGYDATATDFSTMAAGTSGAFALNDFMGMVARSAAAAFPAAVRLDLGQQRLMDTVAVLEAFCRNTAGGITVTIGNDPTFATFSQQVDVTPPTSEFRAQSGLQHAVAQFTPELVRYVLVQVRGDGVFLPQFARAVAGLRCQPGRNFSFGVARGVNDLGSVEFAPRGAFLRRNAAKRRTLGLTWQYVTEAEAEGFGIPLVEQAGTTRCVLAVIDPDPDLERTRRIYFGPLQGNPALNWRGRDRWEKRIQLVSLV